MPSSLLFFAHNFFFFLAKDSHSPFVFHISLPLFGLLSRFARFSTRREQVNIPPVK